MTDTVLRNGLNRYLATFTYIYLELWVWRWFISICYGYPQKPNTTEHLWKRNALWYHDQNTKCGYILTNKRCSGILRWPSFLIKQFMLVLIRHNYKYESERKREFLYLHLCGRWQVNFIPLFWSAQCTCFRGFPVF